MGLEMEPRRWWENPTEGSRLSAWEEQPVHAVELLPLGVSQWCFYASFLFYYPGGQQGKNMGTAGSAEMIRSAAPQICRGDLDEVHGTLLWRSKSK